MLKILTVTYFKFARQFFLAIAIIRSARLGSYTLNKVFAARPSGLIVASALLLFVISLSDASANTRTVHSLKNKIFVAEVAVSCPYHVTHSQEMWDVVRFTVPCVPVWLRASYVAENADRATVTVDKLNARIGPSTEARILAGVNRDYSSEVLDRSNGFVQVYAPTSVLFALKSDSRAKSVVGTTAEVAAPQSSSGSKWQTTSNLKSGADVDLQGVEGTPGLVEDALGTEPVNKANNDEHFLLPGKNSDPKATTQSISPAGLSATDNKSRVIAQQHRLSPGDTISLKVFGEPDLSLASVRIPQSGQVSFPLIGSVKVAERTIREVESILRSTLSQGYINDPKLSVTIDSYRPIFIKGAILTTGAVPYTEGLTIAKVIALAGGAKKSARQDGVSISRDGQEIHRGLSLDSEYQISPGDILSIEEEIGVGEESAFYVYLHGEVTRPGAYQFRKGLTVEKAVVLAGGFTLRASRRRIAVSRLVDAEEKPVKFKKVKLYMPVQPGDIIHVGGSWF